MDAAVRPARPSDKGPLMSFIRDVWGGHDYIPKVWDQWMHDPRARMFVVEVDGVPVGMNRVRFLEDGSAWFEGARVHPDYRGKGLASMLGENSAKVAGGAGVRVFRLTSGSQNRTAHRQISRIRFKEIARFSVYEPPNEGLARKGRALRVTASDLKQTIKLIEKSREFRLGSGVFWHDLTAARLSHTVVKALIDEGAAWRNGDAVAVTREGREGPESWEEICFIGGPPLEALELVESLIGRNRDADERWVFVPRGSPLIHLLRKSGFGRNFSMILFERRAAKG